MNKTRLSPAMVFAIALLALPSITCGQMIAPAFAADYSFIDLGSAQGVPGPYGGLSIKSGDPNTLLLGGSANTGSGAIYTVPLTRDANSHIIGFTGSTALFSTAPNIDGGLAYGPGGVLFFTGYSNNILGEIKPGSTSPDKIINLTALGVASSVGTVQFVPNGFPDAGAIRILSYSSGDFYSATLTPDGTGTYDLSGITQRTNTGGGPEGVIYVPSGAPDFTGPSVLISEYSSGRISAYNLDSNGIPVPSSRRDFITGLSGAEGAASDPVTQDFLFSTFGGGNRVLVVRGFVPPPCTAPPSGMVGWYPGDGNANDISSLGNNGSLQGGATFAPGRVNQAFSLNGTSAFVQAPANGAQDPTTAGSQDAWVYFNQLPGSVGRPMEIIGKGGGGTDFDLQADPDNKFRFYIGAGNNSVSTTVIQTGVWYHVAGTWDSTGIRIYVNGVLEGTNNVQNLTRGQSGNPLDIGYQPSFGGRYFAGLIDEAEVFNRRLNDAEVAAIYNAKQSGKCRNCVPPPSGMNLWLAGDGNGNDLSGNGNTGTPTNGASFGQGFVGQAFTFDGVDDVVQVANSASLSFAPTSPMSVDFWVFRTSNAPIQHFIGKRVSCDPAQINYQLALNTTSGEGLSFGGASGSQANSGLDLPLNTWTHLAGTFDGTTLRLYMNGTLIATQGSATLGPQNNAPLLIGGSGSCQTTGGRIDEVEIFNRALSQAEIQAIVNAGNAGKCKPVQCPTIIIDPAMLPGGAVGTAYSQAVSASGGSGTYTYSVTGTLPPGLTLNGTTGQITGTPTTMNGSPFSFTIKATDTSTNCTGSRDYTITISCPVTTLSPDSLPDGQVNSSYSQTITASGTGGTYSFSRTAGSLPPGLTLSSTGAITGTPTQSGPFNFTVTALDSAANCSGSRSYTVNVTCPQVVVSPASLPDGQVGTAYNQNLSASGTGGSYTFALSGGTLPDGVMLSPSGVLSGTPTQSGTFNFTIRATDASAGCSGTRDYSVMIAPAPTPTPTPTPTATPNQCSVCHKGQTLTLACNSLEYARHLDHGDPARPCTNP